jgi:anti-sigma B factor antagonist
MGELVGSGQRRWFTLKNGDQHCQRSASMTAADRPRQVGFTSIDAPGAPADPAFLAGPSGVEDPGSATVDPLLQLSTQHPAGGICVVTVGGELDMLTAPLLETYITDQLATAPAHLILDLQAVTFLGSSGINSLLRAHALTSHTTRTQLHLAGLATRVVARPLEITGLIERFDTYPTITHALAALTG